MMTPRNLAALKDEVEQLRQQLAQSKGMLEQIKTDAGLKEGVSLKQELVRLHTELDKLNAQLEEKYAVFRQAYADKLPAVTASRS